jgi:tetratricopeptide (TPR) repeat protein
VSETTTFKYRAFLSYSHRDKSWGKWLHAALEGYRIDKDLVGREMPVGPVPKTLRPIFRDREDFSAGPSLTAQTLAALEASQFLIVICSPNAAKSHYVNEEVRRFKALGGAARVIPVIVDGEPGDPARECFPPALRYKIAADGQITDEVEEPIAADARPQGDGKEIAKQKIVAGLLGLSLDEIVRRAERARKRRNRFWAALAGVFLLLAVAASGSAVYAWQQLKTNEAFLNATLKRATEIIDEAVAQAEKYNVPRAATLALLTKAEGLFDDMAQYGRPTPELRLRKAWMLIQFARNYAILGDTAKQFARANEAYHLLAGLAPEKPDDRTYQTGLAVAYDEVGNVLVAQGKLSEALQAYRDSLAIRERLAKADPGNAGWQRELSVSYIKVGEVLVAQGKLSEALQGYRDSLAITERLAKADPGNAGWQRDLAVSHANLAWTHLKLGEAPEALIELRKGREIMARLVAISPTNAQWKQDLEWFGGQIARLEGQTQETGRN